MESNDILLKPFRKGLIDMGIDATTWEEVRKNLNTLLEANGCYLRKDAVKFLQQKTNESAQYIGSLLKACGWQRSNKKPKKEFTPELVRILYMGYKAYYTIHQEYEEYDIRNPNPPEAVTEGIVSLILNATRNGVIGGADLVVLKKEQSQVKATTLKGHDSSTFSPTRSGDYVYFVCIDVAKDQYTVYNKVSQSIIDKCLVNKQESLHEQGKKGRRPHISLYTVMKDNNIGILSSGNIFSLCEEKENENV